MCSIIDKKKQLREKRELFRQQYNIYPIWIW